MSLYLPVMVGDARYLVEAVRVAELRPLADAVGPLSAEAAVAPQVDLRELFGEAGGAPRLCLLVRQSAGGLAALLVDGADGLVELDDRAFRPLPPIGPLGVLIDAVSAEPLHGRPVLRLRAERVLASASAAPAPARASA